MLLRRHLSRHRVRWGEEPDRLRRRPARHGELHAHFEHKVSDRPRQGPADVHVPGVAIARALSAVSVRTRIVLGSLCRWNAGLLIALGVIALFYVDGAAGKVGAGL